MKWSWTTMNSRRPAAAIVLPTFGSWLKRAAALEEIGEERRRHARFGRVRSDGQRADAVASRRAVARSRVAAGNADVAGHRRQRVRRAVELLAVDRAPGSVPAVKRRGLRRPELDRQSPDS